MAFVCFVSQGGNVLQAQELVSLGTRSDGGVRSEGILWAESMPMLGISRLFALGLS